MKTHLRRNFGVISAVILSLAISALAFCALAQQRRVEAVGFFPEQIRDLTGNEDISPKFSSRFSEEIGKLFTSGAKGE